MELTPEEFDWVQKRAHAIWKRDKIDDRDRNWKMAESELAVKIYLENFYKTGKRKWED